MTIEKTKDLTVGNPIKLMLFYAIPVLIGNIFQQIYNLADTMIVGQCLGNDALAAVGNTGSIFFLVTGFVYGVTSGFSVYVAQSFGAKDYERMRNSVFNAMFLWIIITILITIVSMMGAKPLLRLINTPDSLMDASYAYISTICLGIFAPMLYNAMSCILRAIGDSKTPLYFLILSALLNIGLDFLLILVAQMGVKGAGLATVISQTISGILCIIYTKIKFPILHFQKNDICLNLGIISKQLKIGLPMAFQFSITAIGTVILQGAINIFGETYIAAYTAASKVEQLVTQIGPACGVTTANFVGQNIGAGKYDRIKKGVREWSFVTIAASVIASVFVLLLGKYICMLFVKNGDHNVINASMIYLNTVIKFFVPLFLIFIYRNALQAMGKTFMPLMAGVFELVARTVVSFTLPKALGFKGVCLAGPFAWIAAFVPLFITYIIYLRIFRKKGYFRAEKNTD